MQKPSFAILGLDHIQLAAPPGSEESARRFFGEILCMAEIEKPANLKARGGVWFACGAQQLHIGIESGFSPAKKAHPAFHVKDIPALRDRLKSYGIATDPGEPLPGATRFYANDPFGNRLEFLEWNESP